MTGGMIKYKHKKAEKYTKNKIMVYNSSSLILFYQLGGFSLKEVILGVEICKLKT